MIATLIAIGILFWGLAFLMLLLVLHRRRLEDIDG
jgi:hypothetical protein